VPQWSPHRSEQLVHRAAATKSRYAILPLHMLLTTWWSVRPGTRWRTPALELLYSTHMAHPPIMLAWDDADRWQYNQLCQLLQECQKHVVFFFNAHTPTVSVTVPKVRGRLRPHLRVAHTKKLSKRRRSH
jgi:hypothetical protein